MTSSTEFCFDLVFFIYIIAIHLGLTVGWTLGRAISERDWRIALRQYYAGILIVLISASLLIGVVNWPGIALLVIFGLGIGLAYDDRENHPPEGMVTHIIGKIAETKSDVEEAVTET